MPVIDLDPRCPICESRMTPLKGLHIRNSDCALLTVMLCARNFWCRGRREAFLGDAVSGYPVGREPWAAYPYDLQAQSVVERGKPFWEK